MPTETVLQQVTTDAPCDQRGNENIRVQDNSYETCWKTSSSYIPWACAFAIIRSRRSRSRRKNRYSRTASLTISLGAIPSLHSMSPLQKLIAENAESAEIFFKCCSAYSAISAIKNPFAVESFYFFQRQTDFLWQHNGYRFGHQKPHL